jgi:hypothetical protein
MAKRFRFVFTPVGAAVLILALIILVRSLVARNAYEMLLSSVMLLLLLILGIVGRWKSKKLSLLEPGWKPSAPTVAGAGEYSVITGLSADVPLFFRLHFLVRGKFFPAGSYDAAGSTTCPVFAETSASRGKDFARLDLNFPMSGVFMGKGFCRLRDIFGFFSFSCGIELQRTIKVRSSPFFGKKVFIKAQSGAEDKRNKTSSDEERYYMREYTPGDRFRDINWKSSEKIDALITRISPDTQEKVSRIEVHFRNYGPASKAPLEALWLLDRAKSQIAYFLRSLMEANSNFIFHVHAAKIGDAVNEWEIENSDDLDAFLEELAGLSFSPPQNETAIIPSAAGEMYVFSTACDTGLNAFIAANSPKPVSLFFVQPVVRAKKKKKTDMQVKAKPEPEITTLYKRNFFINGCVLKPRWLFRSKMKPAGVIVDKVDMIHAETKL